MGGHGQGHTASDAQTGHTDKDRMDRDTRARAHKQGPTEGHTPAGATRAGTHSGLGGASGQGGAGARERMQRANVGIIRRGASPPPPHPACALTLERWGAALTVSHPGQHGPHLRLDTTDRNLPVQHLNWKGIHTTANSTQPAAVPKTELRAGGGWNLAEGPWSTTRKSFMPRRPSLPLPVLGGQPSPPLW